LNEVLQAPLQSPLLLWLTIAYFIEASIGTYDKRLYQARQEEGLPPLDTGLPTWVHILGFLEWPLKITLLVLNWKYGLFVYAMGFLLSVLPVLEITGGILMAPFKTRNR